MKVISSSFWDNSKAILLPFYSGDLACGDFGVAEDFIESYLSLDQKFLKNKESTFFVRASGDSMLPEIKDQDILVVDRSRLATDQSIVAVFLNGSPKCKQLLIKKNLSYLHSLNEKYKDIRIRDNDELVIFGVVTGIVREL